MPSVLLTGANAFLAAHIINALIRAGYHVTGAVRRAASGNEILSLHPEWQDHLDIVVVEDITDEASWTQSLEGCHLIMLSMLLPRCLTTPKILIMIETSSNQAWKGGNLALLRSALHHAPTVQSIVVTGSINASTTGSPEELSAGPITSSTWLSITPNEARAKNNAYISYCSGKKEAELAIWEFMKTHSPKFTVTVLLPALIFGPPIEPLKGGVKGLHFSSGLIYSLFNGTNETIPPTAFPSYIDARDLADAHVKALVEPKVANKRLTIGGRGVTFTAITHTLAKIPELHGRLPKESGEDSKVTPANIVADEGNKELQMTFRSFDETMADTARRILELEHKP